VNIATEYKMAANNRGTMCPSQQRRVVQGTLGRRSFAGDDSFRWSWVQKFEKHGRDKTWEKTNEIEEQLMTLSLI
jgi:hypothetical protein